MGLAQQRGLGPGRRQELLGLIGAVLVRGEIVAIGAQNTYVIRQGIARAHVPTVVTICAVSDVILIAAGVAGLGAVVGHARGLLMTVRLLGAAFLLGTGTGTGS